MTKIKSFTDLSQSKALAKILPLESADNVIVSFGSREGNKTVVMLKETLDVIRTPFADIRETTMCWSLAALLGVFPYGYSAILTKSFDGKDYYCKIDGKPFETVASNPVDACYDMIIKLNELKML